MPVPLMAIATALPQVAGALQGAIGGAVDQFKKVTDSVRPFVDAFSNAGQQLDYAFKSLYATVGFSLEPVIGAATMIVEKFADAISEGMNTLREPIEQAAGLFVGSLNPFIEATASAFSAMGRAAERLAPLMEPIGAALEAVGGLAHILTTVFGETLVGLIEEFMPTAQGLNEITEWLTAAFTQLAETTLRLADFMLSVIGMDKLMQPILEALAKERKAGGRREAKPENFGVTGIEDLYRRRLVASAGAAGKRPEEQSRDYLAEIRKLAEKMLEEMKKRPEEREAKRKEASKIVIAEGEGLPVIIAKKILEVFGGRNKDRNEP